jgi:cell wall-associated NlpC family hydrolase
MRRATVLPFFIGLACLLAGTAHAAHPALEQGLPPSGWADREIRSVVAAGLMGPSVEAFRPDDPLTRDELSEALVGLGRQQAGPQLPNLQPNRLVTVRELDARLVVALGLGPAARRIHEAVRTAGLEPVRGLGTETVARLLGLRVNHPQGQEHLELAPRQPVTRAETAYSLAQARELAPYRLDGIRTLASAFALPVYDDWQRAVLARAVRFVGLPYVWAGTSERPQDLYYGSAPGGFDCSGFVWRVLKLEPFRGAPALAATLRGRTTFSMSAEIPRAERISREQLQPADLLFFGERGPASAPAEVGHMGIYAGNGWFVHSSGNGVTLQPLEGWYLERLAWGRRVLAEAGLATSPA